MGFARLWSRSFGCRAAVPVVCVVFSWAAPATAQVDINIESRIDSLTPTFPEPVSTAGEKKTVTTLQRIRRPDRAIDADIAAVRGIPITSFAITTLTAATREQQAAHYGVRTHDTKVVKQIVVTPRKTKAQLALALTPSHDNNVFRARQNTADDFIFGIGGSGTIAVPIGPVADQLVFSGAASVARYREYTTRDFDTIKLAAAYQMVREHHTIPGLETSNAKTSSTFEIANTISSTFEPTFERKQIYFVTPSLSFTRRNIPLSDEVHGKERDGPFLYFADIGLSLGHSFSDIVTQENSSAALTGKIGWRIRPDLTLSGNAGITGRHYDNFVGGRDDLAFSAGPRLDYRPNAMFSAALSLNYTRQVSTVRAAEYDGFVALAQFTFTANWEKP